MSAHPFRSKPIHHLRQEELAQRWGVSPRTLERQRWLGVGPRYLKLLGRVAYRLADVEEYEAANLRTPATRIRGNQVMGDADQDGAVMEVQP